MKILSFDSSTKAASIALQIDDVLVGEIIINDKRTHSQKLMPMLDSLLDLADTKIDEIDLIGVCIGPGSFTGIRIALATVKAISHVKDIPIIAVNSLETLAQNVVNTDKIIVPILDAQADNVYAAIYKAEKNELEKVVDIDVISIDDLLDSIRQNDSNFILLGEGTIKHKEKLKTDNIEIVDTDKNISKASSICVLAKKKYEKNIDIKNAYDLEALYIRKSQAEIQYEEKIKRNEV
ncbi:tRNA (adenosine(37)-N6)-threonylcarbamoyltransferase complex dimerization subunit type 1 TsaB [Peptostreptococcus equinus]|uniref:tRNA (Adenosine(37)-N6)-threonylcarbamoyltransferase complex dimerization subunit type 1 TsaB n=1 Tax=Peptostreptococcus equinus TaxID=3003601 RepID=A0ABY7JMR9_9FIRM|nr:tRNA (adenosine(37)-N6)-threonylcarbamoyltransferase complex dimerization subunit type 1 TsaB [Peptostreptococcus sp. CBA3647]WAW14665.1 tRNA (adenosine(37)-N6)-threonylcarbamoyltransferase complex dimerization subunit type 1 TsaB [Peptostreptococcus sp. CBA3647]